MIRSIGVALFAAALFGVAGGVADAKLHHHAAVAAQAAQTEVLDTTSSSAPAATSGMSSAPVRDVEITSNMPTADADLHMWSDDSARPKSTDPVHRFARGVINRTSTIAMSLTRSAMRYIGTPYVFGGTSPSGFDCSGYVQYVFGMFGIHLPRTADAQYYAGRHPDGGIQVGDLVFFQTYEPGPSHVGIYVGGGKFIQSSSHGVMISSLADSYWAERYLGAKRVVALH